MTPYGGSTIVRLVKWAMSGADPLLQALERGAPRTTSAPPTVGLVLAGYSAVPTTEAAVALSAWAESYGGRVVRCLVLNGDRSQNQVVGWPIVVGSNTAHEFSAYDEGRSALSSARPQVWMFANERLNAYSWPGLECVDASVLAMVAHHGLAVGHIDEHPSGPADTRAEAISYVRSNFLIVADSPLQKIGSMATYRQGQADALFPAGWPVESADAASDFLSASYLADLRVWLTGVGARGQSGRWYRATNERGSLPVLREKAVSILNEHSLSLRLHRVGALMVDLRGARRIALLQPESRQVRSELRRAESGDVHGWERRGERWRAVGIRSVVRLLHVLSSLRRPRSQARSPRRP